MASNDVSTGSTMNAYLNQTFMIACGFYSFLIFDEMPRYNYVVPIKEDNKIKGLVFDPTRYCGPFISNNQLSPAQETNLFPKDDTLVSRIVFCFLLQFSVYSILYMISYNLQSKIGILKKVQDLKFKEFENKIKESQEKLNKLDMKEKLLRQQAKN